MKESKTMTPAIYEDKRNRLIKLTENVIADCKDLPDRTVDELNKILKKLKQNSFEIVLVGEFQGGKSTTFDTICDGREISPRGSGIKTSACVVSATALPKEKDEYVELTWKSNAELLQTMFNFISERDYGGNKENKNKFIREIKTKVKNGDAEESLPDIDYIGNLEDPEIYKIAKKCIDEEWVLYNNNRSSYTKNGTDKLDLLQISTLILRFINDSRLKELRKKDIVKIEELQKMVVFPIDWMSRWAENSQNAKFDFEEVNFVFLAKAHCYIHCKNLERLGYTITDCPGLFASPWDTAIANMAMREADAIMYLLGGNKSIKAEELKAVSIIQNNKQRHKLFFALNAQQPKMKVISWGSENKSALNRLGLNLKSEEEIHVFHALLAFYAKSRDTTISSNLYNYIYLPMLNYFEFDLNTAGEKVNDFVENPNLLSKECGFDELMNAVENAIVKRKFEAILRKNGLERVEYALNELGKSLQSRENEASKTIETRRAEVSCARKSLADFQSKVTKLIESKFENIEHLNTLTDNFFNEVIKESIPALADAITYEIRILFQNSKGFGSILYDICTEFWYRKKHDDTKFRKEIKDCIKKALNEVFIPASEGWSTNVQSGDNIIFNNTYLNSLHQIENSVRTLWDNEYQMDNSLLLNGIPLVIYIKSGHNPIDFAINKSLVKHPVNALGKVLALKIAALVVAGFLGAIIGVVSTCVLDSGIFSIPSLILSIIAGGGVGYIFSEKIDDTLQNTIAPKLRIELDDLFREKKVADDMKKEISDVLHDFVSFLKESCYDSLKKQREDFELRVKEKELLMSKSLDEQRRIGAECKSIRKNQIDPAIAKVAEFSREMEPYFK